MTIIAGIDLAWSGRKPSGICIMEATPDAVLLHELRCTEPATDAVEVAGILGALGPDVVAGIDAPLIVGDHRRAEAELARTFGRQGVYAYSARMDFLDRHGIAEGPRLGRLLRESGWNLDPSAIEPAANGRHALEVFPHAIIVGLFGAPHALKYKKGARALRLGPMSEFQRLLRTYADLELPCLLSDGALGLLTGEVLMASGMALKAIEDRMDAMACAIAAYHLWKHGTAGCSVFGDSANGYIAVPERPADSPCELELETRTRLTSARVPSSP